MFDILNQISRYLTAGVRYCKTRGSIIFPFSSAVMFMVPFVAKLQSSSFGSKEVVNNSQTKLKVQCCGLQNSDNNERRSKRNFIVANSVFGDEKFIGNLSK